MSIKSDGEDRNKISKKNLFFANKLIKKGINDFKLVDDYNSETIILKHEKCGNSFEVNPNTFFKRKEKCPNCKQNRINKEYQEVLDVKLNKEFKLISNYYNNRTRVKLEHKCGGIIEQTPRYINDKSYEDVLSLCTCYNQLNKNETFKEKLLKKGLSEYELVGDYSEEIVTLKHTICNSYIEANPNKFLKIKQNCKVCKQYKINNKYQEKLDIKLNKEFKLISDYKDDRTKVKLEHKCGGIIEQTPRYINGKSYEEILLLCDCYSKTIKNESFKKKLLKKGLSEYELVGNYNEKTVRLKHTVCNSYIKVNPDNFFRRKEKCEHCLQIKLNEKFQKFLNEKFNNEFELVSNYKGSRAKVSIRHINCFSIIEKTPDSLNKVEDINSLCKCTRHKVYINNDEIIRKKNLFFDNKLIKNGLIDFKRRSNYITGDSEIRLYHIKCKKEFTTTPDNFFKRKDKCKCCSKRKQKGISIPKNDFYQNKLNELTSNEFLLISDYYNMHSYVKLKHLMCGHIFETRADNFENAKERCPKCAGREDANKTSSQKIKEIEKSLDNEFKILTKYFTLDDRVKLRHKKCGTVIERRASSLPNGRNKNTYKVKCKVCDLEKRRDNFLDKLNRVQGDNFTLRGKYKGMNVAAVFRHVECGATFKVTPNYILKKQLKDCPKCRK